jgi:hypothetical protein
MISICLVLYLKMKNNIIFSFQVNYSLLCFSFDKQHACLDKFDLSLGLFYLFYQAIPLWFSLYSLIFLQHKVLDFFDLLCFTCFLFFFCVLYLNGIWSLFITSAMCLNQSISTSSLACFFLWLFKSVNGLIITFIKRIIWFRQPISQVL